MKQLALYILALLVLGSLVYLIYTNAPRLPEMSDSVSTSTSSTTAGEEKSITEDTPQYSIDVTYRHFGIPAIDAHVDAEVSAVVAAFKQDAGQIFEGEPDMPQYTLSGEAADFYFDGDVVSQRINLYQYTGGAHGLPIVLTLNYDAASGRELTLDDALALTGLTLKQVSDRALTQLDQEFGESVFAAGAAPQADNYQTFIVTPYKVTFIFQAYQVVAYAAGMPEVSFARK